MESKVQNQEKLKKFDFIRISTPDLNGAHMSKLVSTELSQRIINNKIDIYGGIIGFGPRNQYVEIPEFTAKSENAFFYPDFQTLRPIKWADNHKFGFKVGEVIAELKWNVNSFVESHPRVVARKQLERLEKMDLMLYSAFEPEFRAFKPNTFEPFSQGLDMYKTSLLAIYQTFFMDAVKKMEEAGVDIQDCCNEHGEGQLEMPLLPSYGIMAADNAFRFKQGIKEIALQHEMMISFMTKPFLSETCSGNHYNHSLWKISSKENAMYDESKEDNLSELALYWIGGLMKHLAAICALCCPTVNCYQRLHQFIVPGSINWDINDRLCSIRVKTCDRDSTYVENRLPSSASSPYHVMAATIAAGMDGLENKIDPPPKGDNSLGKLPHTFSEALDLLDSDIVIKTALGEKFVNYFIQIKRDIDLKEICVEESNSQQKLDQERYQYFEYI